MGTLYENEYQKLKSKITTNSNNLIVTKITTHKVNIEPSNEKNIGKDKFFFVC